MPKSLSGLLDRNVLTILAVTAVVVFALTAAIAAVSGHYDSASVRAFIDDVKYVAGLLGLGAAVGRGAVAAAQRHVDGQALLRDLPAAPADADCSKITTAPGPQT